MPCQFFPFLFFLQVKRPIKLHEGHLDFSINIWDSRGRKHTLPIRLLHQQHHRDVDMEVKKIELLKGIFFCFGFEIP